MTKVKRRREAARGAVFIRRVTIAVIARKLLRKKISCAALCGTGPSPLWRRGHLMSEGELRDERVDSTLAKIRMRPAREHLGRYGRPSCGCGELRASRCSRYKQRLTGKPWGQNPLVNVQLVPRRIARPPPHFRQPAQTTK